MSISEQNKQKGSLPAENGVEDEQRRNFLKKSAFAAYATPVIMALLVEKANAWSSVNGKWCPVHGWVNQNHPTHY